MSKHFLISALESGVSLIDRDSHVNAVAMLDTALNSTLLAKVDVCSSSLPHDVKAQTAYAGDDDFWPHPDSWFAAFRPYKVKNGILTIPVRGVLLHGVSITFGRYMTGYEYIVKAVQRAILDPLVRGIVFHIDSPGGHVSGCFDTCDLIWSCPKPTVAFCADTSASAAYAISASCNRIIGTQTVETGSIGVLATFLDQNGALDRMGLKFHYVSAPENGFKEEGHLGTKITKEMLERTQKEVNETYEIFVNVVARGRKMKPEDIRATKALTYRKEASLAMGLIDMVASSVDIATVAQEVIFATPDNTTEETASATEKETEMDPKELEAKLAAAREEGAKSARDEAAATAQKAAKDRIAKIIGSEEAKGAEALAQHFAFNTDMDADTAIASLKVAPKAAAPDAEAQKKAAEEAAAKAKAEEEAAARKESFDKTMSQHAPNLSADDKKGDKKDDKKDDTAKSVDASLDLMRKAGIGGYREKANA